MILAPLRRCRSFALAGLALVALTSAAVATPALKAQVDISGRVVTVGDMFTDAGALADAPLFLAPAPGTSGLVGIAAVRAAADKAGLASFDAAGLDAIRVSRLSVAVTPAMLTALISADMQARGQLAGGVSIAAAFDNALTDAEAAAVAEPVQLVNFSYLADNGRFAARFTLAGIAAPLDVTGRIELMVDAPQLVDTLPAGTLLNRADIVLQKVPLRLVENGNVAGIDQLVGKQLQRQSRAGMVLKASDVADPQLIARNGLVTVYLHAGPLTLTVKGTALNAASRGQPVAVLNTASKRIVHGLARGDGAVEVTTAPLSVAGL